MANSPENNRKELSIFAYLPYRVTPEGYRAYDAEFYLREVNERERIALGKAYRAIGIAENGTAAEVNGKVIYFKGKSG